MPARRCRSVDSSSRHRHRVRPWAGRWGALAGGSGDEFERRAVGGAHDGEVSPVESRYTGLVEPLGDRHDAGVGAAEGQVDVGLDEVGDSFEIRARQVLDREISLGDGTEERGFGFGSALSAAARRTPVSTMSTISRARTLRPTFRRRRVLRVPTSTIRSRRTLVCVGGWWSRRGSCRRSRR